MRKLILISAMVLVLATVHAATVRGLVLALNGAAVTEPVRAQVNEQPAAPAQESEPVYVARPATVEVKTESSKPSSTPGTEKTVTAPASTAGANPSAGKVEVAKAEKPRRGHLSTEARVIYELHRHGIYW